MLRVVLVESVFLFLAVGVLGLWLLSVALDDREESRRHHRGQVS
jgi:hypothetical protein